VLKQAVLLILCAISFHAQALQFENLGAWKYQDFESDQLSRTIFQAEGALTFEGTDGLNPKPVVFIRSLKGMAIGAGEHKVIWRKTLKLGPQNGRSIVKEQVFKKDGRWHYFAKIQTNTGTENMLNSTLLATEIKGTLYMFTFDGHREIYQSQSPMVETLLKGFSVLAN
jgi:hypothetical protein